MLCNPVASTMGHLVGRLPTKRRVWDLAIVRRDVEGHQPAHGGDVVQGVEVQPLMFERTPPGLDHGIGERHIAQRQHPRQQSRFDESVHARVDVLDAGVGDQGRRIRGSTAADRPMEARTKRIEWVVLDMLTGELERFGNLSADQVSVDVDVLTLPIGYIIRQIRRSLHRGPRLAALAIS